MSLKTLVYKCAMLTVIAGLLAALWVAVREAAPRKGHPAPVTVHGSVQLDDIPAIKVHIDGAETLKVEVVNDSVPVHIPRR